MSIDTSTAPPIATDNRPPPAGEIHSIAIALPAAIAIAPSPPIAARHVRAYFRISTELQDRASQEEIVRQYCEAHHLFVCDSMADTIGGALPWQKRGLAELLNSAAPGETIIVSEISRIARSTVGVLTFLQAAAAKGVTVIAAKNALALDGSLPSRIVVTVIALCAEIERELLSTRTKAGIAARRAKGLHIGRPRESGRPSRLVSRDKEIRLLLDKQVSIRALARICACSATTMAKYIKYIRKTDAKAAAAAAAAAPGAPA